MVGEFFINGEDAHKTYGITFGADSLAALLTPPPVKSYIQSKSALMHGIQVLTSEETLPKVDARDVQLIFYLRAKDREQFITRYEDVCEVLRGGKIDIRTKYQPKVTYHFKYISCTQFSQFNGRLAKFILKLEEPNPQNRL